MCTSVEHPWLLSKVLIAIATTRLYLSGSNSVTLEICPLGYSKMIFQMSQGRLRLIKKLSVCYLF